MFTVNKIRQKFAQPVYVFIRKHWYAMHLDVSQFVSSVALQISRVVQHDLDSRNGDNIGDNDGND